MLCNVHLVPNSRELIQIEIEKEKEEPKERRAVHVTPESVCE